MGKRLVLLLVCVVVGSGCDRERERTVRTPLPARRKPPIAAPAFAGVKHVLVVILENGNPREAGDEPFMQMLAGQGMVFHQYYAVAHPSQPNYIALISGSTKGAMTNKDITLDRPHIGNVLGDRWKVYAEDYPAVPGKCNLVTEAGPDGAYVRRHVPFLSFKDVQESDCHQVVTLNTATDPVGALRADVEKGTLPAFGLIIPNLVHDAHGTRHQEDDRATRMHKSNDWLMANIAPLLPKLPDDAVFLLTFDEDETSNKEKNRIFTAMWGKHVRHGTHDELCDHEDMLATFCALLQVPPPPFDEDDVRPITGIWQ